MKLSVDVIKLLQSSQLRLQRNQTAAQQTAELLLLILLTFWR